MVTGCHGDALLWWQSVRLVTMDSVVNDAVCALTTRHVTWCLAHVIVLLVGLAQPVITVSQ